MQVQEAMNAMLLMWATVLELDVVPLQEWYPSFWR